MAYPLDYEPRHPAIGTANYAGSMRAAQMSVAVLLLSTGCEALVLGRVLRPGPVASRAGTAQLGFFDDLFSKPKPEELIGDVENVAGFSDEEFLALKLCSLSEDAPCRAGKYQVIENAPKSLLTDTFMELPRSYYDIFRNRRGVPAPAEVWPFVRKQWPVLADKTDEELIEAMVPITAVFVDIRSL